VFSWSAVWGNLKLALELFFDAAAVGQTCGAGQIGKRLVAEAQRDRDGAFWPQGYIGTVYTTATNLVILQLDKGSLPIYQR
jgi:hypothetical protein